MNKKSFTDKLSRLLKLQLLSLIILLIVFVWISYRTVKRELDMTSANFLSTYGSQIENRIDGMEKVLSRFLYRNTELNMIRSSDEMTRHYTSVRLQNSMEDLMTIDTNAEFLVVAEGDYDLQLDSGSSTLSAHEKQALRDYTMRLSKESGNMATQWEIEPLDEEMYLYKASVQNKRAVGIFLSVDALLNTISNPELRKCEFILTDREGSILGTAGYPLLKTEPGTSLQELSGVNANKKYYDLQEGKFRLYIYEPSTFFLGWIRNGMVILAFLVLFLYLFTAYLRRDIGKELILPMKKLTENMKQIQRGDYELRMDENSENLELSMLTTTFNQLMDEIIHLKIRNYEKKLELQEADQKYIRLQLRPHFFLNAMATVSSMSETGKNKEVQQYIQALSKNIRYMFASGMYTVPVPDAWEDGMYILQSRCPQAVFSHEAALYLLDLAEREPLKYTVTLKAGYKTTNLTNQGVKVYTVKKEEYPIGITEAQTPMGHTVRTYNAERTICDILQRCSKVEIQDRQAALKGNVRRRDRNIPLLMEYAEEFKVDIILRTYLEVLL